MQSRVEEALDKVRPAMRADGGDARIVACDEESGSVSIQMIGACKGCPLSQLDFYLGAQELAREGLSAPAERTVAGDLGLSEYLYGVGASLFDRPLGFFDV